MAFSALDSIITGPLFATAEMASVFSEERRLAAMLQFEAALARAEAKHGLVPAELAAAIEQITPTDFDLAALGRETAVVGVPVIPFLTALQARLPKELEPHLHKGATTQDVMDTSLVLQLREALDLIRADTKAILDGLANLARQHRSTPCVGRTYGQHAAPISFGYRVAVWLSGIADAAEQLTTLRPRILVLSLGGPVGTLASLGDKGPDVAAACAEELGLAASPVAWHATRGRIAETGACLAVLVGALAKMAGDIVHLSSTDVGEVAEPHVPGRGGSSAMPHKRNPVSSTVILAAHGACKSAVTALLDSMAAAHERPAGAWHAEWHVLPQLFGLVSGALREARFLAEGLVVDANRMGRNLDTAGGLLYADAAAALLAAHMGRAAAHQLVEQAADHVRITGEPLRDVLERDPRVPQNAVAEAFEPTKAVQAAALWIDRALDHAQAVKGRLR